MMAVSGPALEGLFPQVFSFPATLLCCFLFQQRGRSSNSSSNILPIEWRASTGPIASQYPLLKTRGQEIGDLTKLERLMQYIQRISNAVCYTAMSPSGFVRTLTSTGALSPLELLDRTSASYSVSRQQAAHQGGVSDRQRQLRTAGPFPPALGAVLSVVAEVAPLAECRQVEQRASLRPLVVHVGGG